MVEPNGNWSNLNVGLEPPEQEPWVEAAEAVCKAVGKKSESTEVYTVHLCPDPKRKCVDIIVTGMPAGEENTRHAGSIEELRERLEPLVRKRLKVPPAL